MLRENRWGAIPMVVVTAELSGPMQPTIHAKRRISEAMYLRGKGFVGAALLLQKQGGYEFVSLHLLCQGIEIVLKALLLLHDYDRYKPRMGRRKGFGHDLVHLEHEVRAIFGIGSGSNALSDELNGLNGFFAKHQLRYASLIDILVDPRFIPVGSVIRQLHFVMKWTDRRLARGGAF